MNQMTPEQQAQMMGMLANMLGINNGNQFQPQQPQQHNVGLPIGVYGRDHKGIFLAKSVNDLTSWDETVLAEDGGTHEGLKVFFCNMKELKKNEKSFSRRKSYMARFEIMRARGRNPLNEVINVFMKDEHSHIPYLNPREWDNRLEEVTFRNIDDDTVQRFRINTVTFGGEIISDSIHQKCINILSRLKGLYVYNIDGTEYDEEGPYNVSDESTEDDK